MLAPFAIILLLFRYSFGYCVQEMVDEFPECKNTLHCVNTSQIYISQIYGCIIIDRSDISLLDGCRNVDSRTKLIIRDSNCIDINEVYIKHCRKNLYDLVLQNCSIQRLTHYDSSTLTYLDLSHNELVELNLKIIDKNLLYLNLSSNNIALLFNSKSPLKIDEYSNEGSFYGDYDYDYQKTFKIQTLDLARNKVRILTSNIFSDFTNLKFLNISFNRLSEIEPAAFNDLNHLFELHLKGNNLTQITHGIYNSLLNLQHLDLSQNEISNIIDYAFSGLTQLKYLNLRDNKLEIVTELVFNGLTKLEYIDLSGNHFKKFFVNYLSSLVNVKHVVLSSSGLSEWSEQFAHLLQFLDVSNNSLLEFSVKYAEKLNWLELSNNLLKTIPNLLELNMLYFNVSHNKISAIQQFKYKSEVMDFSYNNIAYLDFDCFDHLNTTKFLDLSHNNITHLPTGIFSKMENLLTLNLSSNIIPITIGTFSNLINLKTLDLSNMDLKNLPKINFHDLGKLENLDVSGNKISEIDVPKLLSTLRSLKWISLHDNNFTSCVNVEEITNKFKDNGIQIFKPLNANYKNFSLHGIQCEHVELKDFRTKIFDKNGNSETNNVVNEINTDFNTFLNAFELLIRQNNNITKSFVGALRPLKSNVTTVYVNNNQHNQSIFLVLMFILIFLILSFCLSAYVYITKKAYCRNYKSYVNDNIAMQESTN